MERLVQTNTNQRPYVVVLVLNLLTKLHLTLVPLFGCMLAHDGAKHPKKITGVCYIEYKYDGVRVIAIVQNGDCYITFT